jgi:hypothetical protein
MLAAGHLLQSFLNLIPPPSISSDYEPDHPAPSQCARTDYCALTYLLAYRHKHASTPACLCTEPCLTDLWVANIHSVNKSAANKPFYELKNESDTTLVFDSLFESGNLYQAHQVDARVRMYCQRASLYARARVNERVLLIRVARSDTRGLPDTQKQDQQLNACTLNSKQL